MHAAIGLIRDFRSVTGNRDDALDRREEPQGRSGVVMVNRATRRGSGCGLKVHHTALVVAATTAATAKYAAARRHRGVTGAVDSGLIAAPALADSRSTNRTAAASLMRSRRSLTMHRSSIAAIARHVAWQRGPVGFGAKHCCERLCHIVAAKRALAGEHLVEHAAERPDVAALVAALPLPAPDSCTPPCRGSCPCQSSMPA